MTSTRTYMNSPLQAGAPRPLLFPHPTPSPCGQHHPSPHNNPKPTPFDKIIPYSHKRQQRTRRSAATRAAPRSSSCGRRAKHRSGRDRKLRSRASGSTGRQSRAGGDGVEMEAKLNEYDAPPFLLADSLLVMLDEMEFDPFCLLAGLSALHCD